jgi:hypothetical protein
MKVGRPRTLNHSRTTSLVIEEQTLADFAAAIGDKNVSEALREHMEAVVQEYKKEKNLMAPNENLGAIRTARPYIHTIHNIYTHPCQTTLDKYVNPWILNWKDYQALNEIQAEMSYEEQTQVITAFNKTAAIFKSRIHLCH